jgi:AcrR family transcriptional regulator
MTDSPSRTATATAAGKRERLVASAVALVHEQGARATTLADVAQAADVPLGNVYYYFKTKDELLAATVEAHAAELRAALAQLDEAPTPAARLKAFVAMVGGQGDLAARSGCPQGTLCSELDKRDDELSQLAAKLMQIPLDWAERQFAAMGRSDARELATALIAAYQGISLLTNTLRDPSLMTTEARRLSAWIDALEAESGG